MMSTAIIDIDLNQLTKLKYTASYGQENEKRNNIRQKLQAALAKPARGRQKMSFIVETKRGFFRVESQPMGLTERFASVKGGYLIPLESILKVI